MSDGKKVSILVDYNSEMLSIEIEGAVRGGFYGNFWDFDRPEGIISLLKGLGVEVVLEEKPYDDWH